jgi:endonuclease YncB( thermonuclease family)
MRFLWFLVPILLVPSVVIADDQNIGPSAIAVISGIAGVHDGDGILFGEVEVRLQGIAAPEYWSKREDWGAEARQNLVDLAWGKYVICHLDGTTASSKRPVGVCYVDNADLGYIQVLGGFARDCPKYSNGRYREAELEAREQGFDLSQRYELPEYCGRTDLE